MENIERSEEPEINFFKENLPVLLMIVPLILVASLLFYASGAANPSADERRVDEIIRTLDKSYAPGADAEERRHAVQNLFSSEQHHALLESIFLHLAVALTAAVVLIISVDTTVRFMTKKEYQKQTYEVSQKIWKAMLRRFVPEEVAETLETILKSNVCRIRPTYEVTLRRNPYRDVPAGKVVVRRELLYRLRNLTCDAIPNYEIKSKVYPRGDEVEMLDENGSRVALPAIKEVTVDGKALSINNPEEVNEKIPLKKMASAEQAVEVRSVAEELFSTRDNAIYIITEPCVGLELRIVNEAPELIQIDPENVFLSGRWGNRLRRDMDGGWTCNAGILPGTVLVVSWKPKGGPLLAPDDRLSEI